MTYLDNFYHHFYGPEDGKKLVFLHGMMGFSANWRRIAAAFEAKYRILVFDQRGHGRSYKPPSGYSPADYADDLRLILDELGWEKILLVGHSMGGRNALYFTSHFPQRVEKLVIEDIGPDEHHEALRRYEKLINSIPTPFVHKREAKSFLLNELKNPTLGQFLYSNLEETESGQYDWRFSKKGVLESLRLGHQGDHWSELKKLQVPTLLVRGETSEDLRPEIYQRCLELNPLIQGRVIKNAGHWVHFDQPETFIQVLKEFFGIF